ncbi:hypothetical protein HDV00_000701 [Rhizophlyctis rosea]|nr:hypothetical protein HDV00_000701 [Rhizophlyctis rosea]
MRSILVPSALLVLLASAWAAEHTVQVGQGGLKYDPATLTINVGDSVTWNFASQHSVTSQAKAGDCKAEANAFLNSGDLATGTYSKTFMTAGTFEYFCVCL